MSIWHIVVLIAVMAFWGAPGRVEKPAASACRAAIAIQRALAA
jgi:adenylate cyclase